MSVSPTATGAHLGGRRQRGRRGESVCDLRSQPERVALAVGESTVIPLHLRLSL